MLDCPSKDLEVIKRELTIRLLAGESHDDQPDLHFLCIAATLSRSIVHHRALNRAGNYSWC